MKMAGAQWHIMMNAYTQFEKHSSKDAKVMLRTKHKHPFFTNSRAITRGPLNRSSWKWQVHNGIWWWTCTHSLRMIHHKMTKLCSGQKRTDRRTDGQTDRRTDRRTDGRSDSSIPPHNHVGGIIIYLHSSRSICFRGFFPLKLNKKL